MPIWLKTAFVISTDLGIRFVARERLSALFVCVEKRYCFVFLHHGFSIVWFDAFLWSAISRLPNECDVHAECSTVRRAQPHEHARSKTGCLLAGSGHAPRPGPRRRAGLPASAASADADASRAASTCDTRRAPVLWPGELKCAVGVPNSGIKSSTMQWGCGATNNAKLSTRLHVMLLL